MANLKAWKVQMVVVVVVVVRISNLGIIWGKGTTLMRKKAAETVVAVGTINAFFVE
jgi:hypothetical protein